LLPSSLGGSPSVLRSSDAHFVQPRYSSNSDLQAVKDLLIATDGQHTLVQHGTMLESTRKQVAWTEFHQKVYYGKECHDAILRFVLNARENLLLAMFRFTDPAFMSAIIDASKKMGPNLLILLDDDPSNQPAIKCLTTLFAVTGSVLRVWSTLLTPARGTPFPGHMHVKLLITWQSVYGGEDTTTYDGLMDRKEIANRIRYGATDKVALFGSCNCSRAAKLGNCEMMIGVTDQKQVNKFIQYYYEICSDAVIVVSKPAMVEQSTIDNRTTHQVDGNAARQSMIF